ncbi:MAG: NOL1/NOP2/sun family putative RNA methylase [Candidatus Woesearchaeota archaeon]
MEKNNNEDKMKNLPELKEEFKKRYKELLGADYADFIKYSSKYIRKSIRINTLKTTTNDIKNKLQQNWELEQVPWCTEGFWINYKNKERYDVGNLPEHQLGYIYVQDAASMIPPVVLNPKPGDIVLDVCAAPGSKTTQMAQYMKNEGIIMANDAQGKRLSALGINLQRCGITNVLVTKMNGEKLAGDEKFDKILLDAPCSGTGTIRRSYKIAEMWSPNLVDRMSKIQQKLIKQAFKLLKKGGTLVYSTCTLEPQENEGIVSKLLKENPSAKLEEIHLDIKRSKPITKFKEEEYAQEVQKCLRITPQDNDSEGFFVAKITKI